MHRSWAWLSFLLVAGCGGSSMATPDAGSTDAGSIDAELADAGGTDAGPPDAGPAATPVCTDPTPATCTDQSILDLNLFTDPNPATIDNTPDGSGFMTHVDATGGGFDPTLSFVYAKFTDAGLVRVDVGDEAALDSMDWDIAFRRFLIRLNSGPSGPSCVGGAPMMSGTDYDSLDAPPDGTSYRAESYYDMSCTLVPDFSGLGSPGTVLDGFWEYPTSCVKMTGEVYVLQLANGRLVKLTVTSYYDPAVQNTCDTTGTIDMGSPTGSGNIRLRWAYLP